MASGQADKERTQQRVEVVYRLILQGDTIPNIVQNCSKTMGVGIRQVYKYVARARVLIHNEAKRSREEAFDEHLAARRRMRKEAHDANDPRLAFDILRDEAKLRDLYPAAKQQITGKDERPLFEDVAKPLEQIARRIDSIATVLRGEDGNLNKDSADAEGSEAA